MNEADLKRVVYDEASLQKYVDDKLKAAKPPGYLNAEQARAYYLPHMRELVGRVQYAGAALYLDRVLAQTKTFEDIERHLHLHLRSPGNCFLQLGAFTALMQVLVERKEADNIERLIRERASNYFEHWEEAHVVLAELTQDPDQVTFAVNFIYTSKGSMAFMARCLARIVKTAGSSDALFKLNFVLGEMSRKRDEATAYAYLQVMQSEADVNREHLVAAIKTLAFIQNDTMREVMAQNVVGLMFERVGQNGAQSIIADIPDQDMAKRSLVRELQRRMSR